jgi:hypothetical protein
MEDREAGCNQGDSSPFVLLGLDLSPQELKNCKPMNWQQFYTAFGVRMTRLKGLFS